MRSKSTTERIKNIQKHLNLEPDGIIGSDTLTGIENSLFAGSQKTQGPYSLTISRSGMEQLINHEIGSKSYYNRRLKSPAWPGGASGVTIGIGYDLGYNSVTQIQKDWEGKIPGAALIKLKKVAGLKASKAKAVINRLQSIEITYDTASQVFSESTLPRYAASTLKAYAGVEFLYHDAQAALLSLVYNRGASMSGSRRREMAAIKPFVLQKNYSGIAQEILDMKRLWIGRGLNGLLKRRDDEANLVLNANRQYTASELIRV